MQTEQLLDEDKFEDSSLGDKISLKWLQNSNGMKVAITNYGARIVGIYLPVNQSYVDVVSGFHSIDGYFRSTETYYGCIVGRFANRIDQGRFTLDGKTYQLGVNNPPCHLHGGFEGFQKKVWQFSSSSRSTIVLRLVSPDGDQNYPGKLTVEVTLRLTDENELQLEYLATTDAPTILNLTSHPFFNLNGQASGSIASHWLQINASQFTPVNNSIIPKGIENVEGTVFDFREPQTIGMRIEVDDEQLILGKGYDHNMVLDGEGYRKAATATGDRTGISMEVYTDQPGIQLYTGNHLKGENLLKGGKPDNAREAFCLETQHFPDSPNQPQFPSTILRPGETFRSKTSYKFLIPT